MKRDDVNGARIGIGLQRDEQTPLIDDADLRRAAIGGRTAAGQLKPGRAIQPFHVVPMHHE